MKNIAKTFALIIAVLCTPFVQAADTGKFGNLDYERARWHPIHFQPAINEATNEDCLSCHQDILQRKVKEQSPAGIKASESLAWYQTLGVYEGEQETFHARHLTTPIAKDLMNLQCNFCHQGNDPREEAPNNLDTNASGFTLRKMVDPEQTCLRCHGRHNSEIMGIPGSWPDTKAMFGNSCTAACHVAIRTNRHQVSYLNADAIEKAAAEDPDTCYGCHGGRQWYRITYPYPRHTWPGDSGIVPEWAKDRPTESEERFRLK